MMLSNATNFGQTGHLKNSCPVPAKNIHGSKCGSREYNIYAAYKGKLDKQSSEESKSSKVLHLLLQDSKEGFKVTNPRVGKEMSRSTGAM